MKSRENELKIVLRESKHKVLFITEANKSIGFGHLYRSIALAQSLDKVFEFEFCVNDNFTENSNLILSFFPEIVIMKESELLNQVKKYDFIIVDVFNQHVNRVSKLLNNFSGKKALLIDDVFYKKNYDFEIIFRIGYQSYLDQVDHLLSPSGKLTKIYSGRQFLLIRPEFLLFQDKTISKKIDRILVTMGGSDPCFLTKIIAEALNMIGDESVFVQFVFGTKDDDQRKKELICTLNRAKYKYEILSGVSNMAELMHKSDFAIINGGNTRFELSVLRTPFISLSMNATQSALADKLMNEGIGYNIGNFNELRVDEIAKELKSFMTNYELRKTMAQTFTNKIQGNGAMLISDILTNNHEYPAYEFRNIKDSELEYAYKIHCELVEKMLSKGIKQWLRPIDYEKLVDRQKKGENYGLFINDKLAVFLSITQRYDYHEWSYIMTEPGTYWLNTVSVNVNNREKGLGRLAIAYVFEYLKKIDISELYLDCVINDGFLVNYYKNLGFEVLSETVTEYRSGVFSLALMRKKF